MGQEARGEISLQGVGAFYVLGIPSSVAALGVALGPGRGGGGWVKKVVPVRSGSLS